MEIKLLKPILLDNGKVGEVNKTKTVSEQRGRELIRKGYASAPQAEKSKEPAAVKKQETSAKAEKPAAKK